jgi:hypothetical protein
MGQKQDYKKILIMFFNDNYVEKICKVVLKAKNVKIPEELGFLNITKNSNLIYTILSSKMRRIWLHHFLGTHAIILIINSDDIKENINEIISILGNNSIKHCPILIIIDKINNNSNINELENLRYELSLKNIEYNFVSVNFDELMFNCELFYGIDWIDEHINKKED